MNQHSDYTSAREAARMLDVTPATLYAYVSRGLVHSIAAPRGRARLYSLADLQRLRTRSDARRGHTAVAAAALDWGAPVLDSAITRIDPAGGPFYRGRSAVELARTCEPFERVAELLWEGPALWSSDPLAPRVLLRLQALDLDSPSRLARLSAFVAARALLDVDRHARTLQLERDRAATLLHGMASALASVPDRRQRAGARVDAARPRESVAKAGSAPPSNRLAAVAAAALGVRPSARVATAIDQMLVLCADHELNVSTFAVRVTASGGADLYACVTTGLCALSGAFHGGMCDRVELLAGACHAELKARSSRTDNLRRAAERVVRARIAAGEHVPGFGQPLYPEGDPRGTLLLELAAKCPSTRRSEIMFGIVHAMSKLGRRDPTLDMGLCALSAALDLPLGAASAIFALGRVSGWVAHALEQRERPMLLRPRARYVGP